MAVSFGMHDSHNTLQECMSAVLTEGGGLAVCGSDYYGQIGRGPASNFMGYLLECSRTTQLCTIM